MYKVSNILLLLLVSYNLSSQINLVPNPSFEIDTSCGAAIITPAVPWDAPTNGTPDLYNTCSNSITPQAGVPTNNFGFQYAHTGNGYAGASFYNFGPTDFEYIQVELDSNLIANKTYCASFFVSLANPSSFALKNIGMYFSNSHTFQPILSNLSFIPQIIHTGFVTDTLNWVQVKGSFTAMGGERYIIIGNFDPPTAADTIRVGPLPYMRCPYYYIDDVNVHEYSPLIDSCCTCNVSHLGVGELEDEKRKFKLYPNPNNGNMILDYKIADGQAGIISIYDVTGKLLNSHTFNSSSTSLSIDASILNAGAYYYDVKVEDKRVKADKLIIVK